MLKNKTKSIILITILLALILYSSYLWISRPLETKVMDVEFSVGSKTGIEVGTEKLYFGRKVPGNSAERKLDLENNYNFPVKINVFVTKDIAEFINTENSFVANQNEKIVIPVNVEVSPETEYGNYSGKIMLKIEKA